MGPKVSRLLFGGMVLLVGCTGAVQNTNDGVDSAAGSPAPAAGSGGSKAAPPAGAAGTKSAANGGSRAGAPAAPSGGSPAAVGGRSGATAVAGTAGTTAVGGNGGGTSASADAGNTSATAGGGAGTGSSTPVATEKFSFFVTSLEAMQRLSKSDKGFGGDLRYGETSGLAGADKICAEIAESSMPGAAGKGWHAFLSAKAAGPSGAVVHAKDRIGKGPWYDRTGRVIAMSLSDLLATRPDGADPAIADNLPNETGEPNRPSEDVDNHDTLTGSSETGEYSGGATCDDWTTTTTPAAQGGGSMSGGGRGNSRGPMCGHSWPAQSGQSWITAHPAPGCAASVSLVQMGGGSGDGVGNSGGYGGIYCFALSP